MTTFDVVCAVLSVLLAAYVASGYSWFVIRYSRTTWFRTPYGRHLMSHSAALASTFWATLLVQFAPLPLWVVLPVQIGLFLWLAYEVTRRNRLFSNDQRDAERNPR